MRKFLSIMTATISAAILLGACAPTVKPPKTVRSIDFKNVPDQKFMVGGLGAGNPKMVSVRDLTDQQFKTVMNCGARENIAKCAKRRGGIWGGRAFKNSLSGITGRALLRTAQGGRNTQNKWDVKVKGQILDECLHTNIPGYHYKDGNLRLCVIMRTIIANAQNDNEKVRYQYFHIEATSAMVDEKDLTNEDNVFPDAAQATGLEVSKGMAEGFDRKLYAHGANIEIVNYWEANEKDDKDPIVWRAYTKTSGGPWRIRDYFRSNPDACVDMMFPGPIVPEKLDSDAAAGVHYCLGRCKNPPVVNTR